MARQKNLAKNTFYRRVLNSLNNGTFFKKVFYRCSLVYFKLFAKFYKIQNTKIVCQNFIGRGYADNTKYIAEELHRQNRNLEIIWLVNEEFIDYKSQFPEFVHTIPIFTFAALKSLATAKIWISNIRGLGICVPKKNNQIYVQLWHGMFPVKTIEKDAEENLDKGYCDMAKKDSLKTDVCISGCAFMTKIFKESFWYGGEVLECGTPRNDILFENIDAVKIRRKLEITEDEKICLYAPTFRTLENSFDYTLNYMLLKEGLEEKFGGEWKILLRLHPNVISEAKDIPSFVRDVSFYPDVQELLSISNCLISDFSSIMFEFMLTKNPVFIYAPDFEEYIKYERRLYFSLEETPFSIAKTDSELKQNIITFDIKSYLISVERFITRFGLFDDGHASERVVQWMLQKLEEKA